MRIRERFNPRAPCGARPCSRRRRRAPAAFQPTRPLRGATSKRSVSQAVKPISTHAPLAGRDIGFLVTNAEKRVFQPTRPLRGATRLSPPLSSGQRFQPTRPLRGATDSPDAEAGERVISTHAPLAGRDGRPQRVTGAFLISTHAPLAGRDRGSLFRKLQGRHFNPRAPCGARLPFGYIAVTHFEISTHAPLAGRDEVIRHRLRIIGIISTHAPLAGRDRKRVQITMHIFAITDKFQMLLHRMPPVRAFCSFLMQENHADFGCEPPK